MEVNLKKYRWQRVTLICLLVLVLIVLVPSLLVNRYWSPVLANKVKKEILEKTDSLYHIDYSNAELHILRGEVVFYDITLSPDTAVYRRKKAAGFAPNNLYKLHVKRLVVSHIHPFTLYFKKKLNISRITLSAPDLEIGYAPVRQKDTTTKDKRTLWQKMSKSLKSISVGEIFLNDVHFKYKNYSGPKLEVSELKELNFKATGLLIDSTTQFDKKRLLYCKDIVTDLYNYTGRSADGKYTYNVKAAKFSAGSSTLDLQGVDVKPISPAMFFDGTDQDRFTLHLDSVQARGFDVVAYHRYKSFSAAKVRISDGSFSVYSNPHPTVKKTDRVITFPQVGLRMLKTPVHLDSLVIRRLNIYYNEYNVLSKQKGYVAFANTSGLLTNISNNKDSLAKNHTAGAALTSYFMGRGKMDVKFTFNLTDAADSYSYSGHLGGFDLPRINPATMPLAMVKITSGHVNSFDFSVSSTSKVSAGKVTLLYNDLKISMLKPDTEKVYKKKGLASLFVNALVIKHDNPDDGQQVPRTANVRFERPANFPFFKTIWQTLLSGIKPCAGVGRAKEEKALKEMDEHEKKVKERALKMQEKARKDAEKEAKEQAEKKKKEAEKKKKEAEKAARKNRNR